MTANYQWGPIITAADLLAQIAQRYSANQLRELLAADQDNSEGPGS